MLKLDLKAPHQTYRDADGNKLTGVTTYLGVIAKPQLFGWYADVERQGVVAALKAGEPLPTRANGKTLPFAEIRRDKAADLGTITHAQVEAWLQGDTLDPEGLDPAMYEQSFHGRDRFIEWWKGEGFTLLDSELQLVCEHPAYGGTIDIVAFDKDARVAVIDLKTSKASAYWPYDEVYAQVAAYAHALDALRPAAKVSRCIVARIGSTPEDELQVAELSAGQRAAGWNLFTAAYNAYEAKKALDRLR